MEEKTSLVVSFLFNPRRGVLARVHSKRRRFGCWRPKRRRFNVSDFKKALTQNDVVLGLILKSTGLPLFFFFFHDATLLRRVFSPDPGFQPSQTAKKAKKRKRGEEGEEGRTLQSCGWNQFSAPFITLV